MGNLATYLKRHDELINKAKKLDEKAEKDNRNLTDAEQKEFDGLMEEAHKVAEKIKRKQEIRDTRGNLISSPEQIRKALGIGNDGDLTVPTGFLQKESEERIVWYDISGEKHTTRLYRHDEPISRANQDSGYYDVEPLPDGIKPDELDVGRFFRGLITGDWRGAEAEQRTLVGIGSAGGSFLVPTVVSDQLLDLARNASKVMKAGARTFDMPSENVQVAALSSDPTAYWTGEGENITESNPVFSNLEFEAAKLGMWVPISSEVLESNVVNLDSEITRIMTTAMSTHLDNMFLNGSGTNQPLGIIASADLGDINKTSTSSPTAANIMGLLLTELYRIYGANADPANVKALYNADIGSKIANATNGAGAYFGNGNTPEDWARTRKFLTNQIETNAGSDNLSHVVFGDFSQYWVGVARQMTIFTDPYSSAQKDVVNFRLTWRGDAMSVRNDHFSVLAWDEA